MVVIPSSQRGDHYEALLVCVPTMAGNAMVPLCNPHFAEAIFSQIIKIKDPKRLFTISRGVLNMRDFAERKCS